MDYTIRFAKKDDIESIMRFIDTYWRKGHILSRDRELFEWQYGDINDQLNIVIGLDNDGSIQGMLGFIPYGNTENKDIALALWKANPSAGFLGIRLIKYLIENVKHKEVVCPGINLKTTSKIYEYVGMQVGTMTQWYRLAPRDAYLIAKIIDDNIPEPITGEADIELVEVTNIENLHEIFDFDNGKYIGSTPYKSASYISKRYFKHPAYEYRVYAVCKRGIKADTILVFRVQDCKGSHVLRLIDCIGNCEKLKYVTGKIDLLMNQMNCEYTDFYETGIEDEILISAGWRKVEENGNIIPDYFAPFEQRKVDIHFSSTCPTAILFKGDGDQDRPN